MRAPTSRVRRATSQRLLRIPSRSGTRSGAASSRRPSMGLHDRINKSGGVTTLDPLGPQAPANEPADEPRVSGDPYAELKTRIHHECIAKLGAELFKQSSTGDL